MKKEVVHWGRLLERCSIVGQHGNRPLPGHLSWARRFIWNFFRLENEHLNNCGKFRAVRDISVAPLDSSDQADIIRMMDLPDGVVNRLTKKKHLKKTKENDRKPLLKKESIQDLQLELGLSSKML